MPDHNPSDPAGDTPALVFDIETRGFNPRTPSDCFCLVIFDWSGGTLLSCADQPGYTPILQGVELLQQAAQMGITLVAHSGLRFDLPRLETMFARKIPRATVLDTFTAARLLWPDTRVEDAARGLPQKLHGKHSLEAWGHRLGYLKGDYGKTSTWSGWSKEMQTYCEFDVVTTTALWRHIVAEQAAREAPHAAA